MTTSTPQFWSVVVSADRYEAERLYHHDVLEVSAPIDAQPGDKVALVAATDSPVVFALGEIRARRDAGGADDAGPDDASVSAVIAYTLRFFDDLVPADREMLRGGRLDVAAYQQLARRTPRVNAQRSWLVSVDLPIEANNQAEAVRQFWTYVRELGPSELPAFVSPTGNEMAMQAYVLGAQANLDPEEDD